MTRVRLVSMMLVALLGATGLTVVGGAPPAMADPPAVSNHVVTWGTQDPYSEPPAGLTDVVAVAVNPASSLALKSDGTLVQWPDNGVSASLGGLDHVVAIAGNSDYFMALKADGTVVAAGQDPNGQVTVP